jgi:Tfp pilus assembly protein PilV
MSQGRAMKSLSLTRLRAPRRDKGVTLIEALVALMVMSFGMVALVGLMSNLRRSGDLGKQRSEAMRLAQAELATLRSFSLIQKPAAASAPISDYETDIVTVDAKAETPDDSNTTYQVKRWAGSFIENSTEPQARTVQVVVDWKDRATESSRNDDVQQVVLSTVVARVDPAFAAVVSFTPPPGGIRQPADRHPAIPTAAKDLRDKTSVYRPSSLASTVWVFNNLTGVITGVCSIEAGTPVSALTAADVEACKNNTVGYLLSGTIRFSNADPVNPTVPEAAAIPLDVAIVASSYLEARIGTDGRPVKDSAGNVIMDTVMATPPTYQCFNNSLSGSPGTQAFVNYDCIVYPDSGTRRTWSGKVILTGFDTGTTADDHRVCRYSADYNGNGSVYVTNTTFLDNYEHPAVYVKVTGSLARQNFLVVRGDRACPSAPAVDPTHGVFVDYSTAQIQP